MTAVGVKEGNVKEIVPFGILPVDPMPEGAVASDVMFGQGAIFVVRVMVSTKVSETVLVIVLVD